MCPALVSEFRGLRLQVLKLEVLSPIKWQQLTLLYRVVNRNYTSFRVPVSHSTNLSVHEQEFSTEKSW